jgi:hypothetical protein
MALARCLASNKTDQKRGFVESFRQELQLKPFRARYESYYPQDRRRSLLARFFISPQYTEDS